MHLVYKFLLQSRCHSQAVTAGAAAVTVAAAAASTCSDVLALGGSVLVSFHPLLLPPPPPLPPLPATAQLCSRSPSRFSPVMHISKTGAEGDYGRTNVRARD